MVRTQQVYDFSEQDLEVIFPLRSYFHDIVHLNPVGHEAVAQALEAELLKLREQKKSVKEEN